MVFLLVFTMIGIFLVGIAYAIQYISGKEEREKREAKKGLIILGVLFVIVGFAVFYTWETEAPSPKKAPTKETSPVYEGIGITYDQVIAYLSDSVSMEKSTPVEGKDRYMGTTLNKLATIEIIGNKSNISQATCMVGISDDSQDSVYIAAFILRFLKNIAPDWGDSEDWATNSLDKCRQTSQSQEIIIGNKKVSMSLIKEVGILFVTVEKAVNVGTVKNIKVFNAEVVNPKIDKIQTKDYIVLKNGKRIEGYITEETVEFIVLKEYFPQGFLEKKYNKLDIEKIGRKTNQ